MRITPEQAAARVRAGLGRDPQDALEASVVLEAWGGLTARSALPLARQVAAIPRPSSPAGFSRRVTGVVQSESTREVLGLIATLLATTAWVAPLATALGAGSTERAWKIALPISLAVQWFLRRRYLTDARGLGRLRTDRGVAAGGTVLSLLVVVAMLLQPAAALPAALVVTWVGGLLVVVRGWGIPYAACLLAATAAMGLGLPVVTDVLLVVTLTVAAVAAAIVTCPPSSLAPTPWPRSLVAGAIGGTTALLIVVDPTVEWSSWRPFPVIALVPCLLGTVWASRHLNRIWTVLLAALASTDFGDRSSRRHRRVFGRIIVGAFGRLVLLTAAVSVLTYALVHSVATSGRGLALLLLGLGCFGVVGFVAALLESFSRLLAAGVVAVVAVVVAAAAASGRLPGPDLPPLAAAAVAAAVVALWPVARLVSQPDRTLATMI
ncbi:hypothetical protein AB2L27_05405 [Kineococcus sp. LSe6-4]|uniref:Uncharacterized protein n=1 Tax=Kineococcus halophytocola TaxID=3234027 RepID=A0ABV4GY11_9ACTN